MLQQCLAHTTYQQALCLILFTHSLQQPLAIANATLTSQREACAQSQRLAQDYRSRKNAPTIPTQVFPSLKACCSFRAASFSWWSLRTFLSLLVGGKVGQADFMVPSSITLQGGRIKAAAAKKQDPMLSVPPNAVP